MPAGETIRCWLPYPRRDVAPPERRAASVDERTELHNRPRRVPPQHALHGAEGRLRGEPAIFSETFEYTSAGERHDLQSIESLPYDTTSAVYREYTSERERHIRFTPRLRALAARVVGDAATPAQKAERIFRYICEHYPWASAREYSTIDNIPEYVVDNGHGDCGQVSLLFITLCRISGIPAPIPERLHDAPRGVEPPTTGPRYTSRARDGFPSTSRSAYPTMRAATPSDASSLAASTRGAW